MKVTAELEHWQRRRDYLVTESEELARVGEVEEAAIFRKAIPGAQAMCDRLRRAVIGAK
ncbi:MAG: hypothetical protein ACLPKT_06030 [Methylocella sp.]